MFNRLNLLKLLILTPSATGSQSSSSSTTVSYFASSSPATLPEPYKDVNVPGRTSEILNTILDKERYDPKIRPPGGNSGTGATEVSVSMNIRSIESIDDVNMEFSIQMLFRQEWLDPRLKYSHIQENVEHLELASPDRIWKPDIFFSNEKEGNLHELMIPNMFTRILPDGGVMWSNRVTLRLSCPMNLRAYPLDIQSCPIQLGSYGWTTEGMIVKWRDQKPVEISEEFNLPRFKMLNYTLSNYTRGTITGNYYFIQLAISFKRNFGFYFIQIYIPCSMLVFVSWFAFWLEPSAVEARVSLGVTTILAIVTQTYGINQSAPPASYIKAMDVWTSFCQIMVFGALLEFSWVNYIRQSGAGLMMEGTKESFDVKNSLKAGNDVVKAKIIDRAARIVFPLGFILFNVGYWGYYLTVCNN